MTHLYTEYASSALTNSTLHTELTNRENLVAYNFQNPGLTRMFESLSDCFTTALAVMNLEPPIRAVLKPNEQRLVMKSKKNMKSPVYFPVKRKDPVFCCKSFRCFDSGCINISVPLTRTSISMSL